MQARLAFAHGRPVFQLQARAVLRRFLRAHEACVLHARSASELADKFTRALTTAEPAPAATAEATD